MLHPYMYWDNFSNLSYHFIQFVFVNKQYTGYEKNDIEFSTIPGENRKNKGFSECFYDSLLCAYLT